MKQFMLLFFWIFVVCTTACQKKSEDTSEETDSLERLAVESLNEISAQTSSNEGGLSAVSSSLKNERLMQQSEECKYSNRTCSSGAGTISWNSCTISGPKATVAMTGGWTESWSNVGDCNTGYLSANTSVDRSATNSTITFATGANISTDTLGGTLYDGTSIPTGSVNINRTTTTNRIITMSPSNSAIHKVMKGRRGTTLFDYFIKPNVTITGTRQNNSQNNLGATKSVTGNVTIYHNLASYTATNYFSAVTWGNSSCCFPTSGSITSSFSGTNPPSGPILLTFTSTCGEAKLTTPTDSAGTIVILESCQ